MPSEQQITAFWDTIKALHEAAVLPHVVIIGSWAEYLMEQGYLEGFTSDIRTMDVDVLIKNTHRPSEPVNITEVLEEHGFIADQDYLTGTSKFYKDGALELEFLVRMLGRGQNEPYDVPSFGIKAEGLRHLDLLIKHSEPIIVRGYTIYIPKPGAYSFHKMRIDRTNSDKKEKDIRAAARVMEAIRNKPSHVEVLRQLYINEKPATRLKILARCAEADINLLEIIGIENDETAKG